MSFGALQERLSESQDILGQIHGLIERLANVKFEPGSVPLNTSDENNVAGELSTAINQLLRDQEEDLELLQEEISDLRSGRPGSEAEHCKQRLQEGAARLGREIKECCGSFRKAQVSARDRLKKARLLESELLLASYVTSALTSPNQHSGANSPGGEQSHDSQQPQKPVLTARDRRRVAQRKSDAMLGRSTEDVALMNTSEDVTEALRRTHELITNELARSDYARQQLAASTEALAQLSKSYSGLDNILSRSRDLVGTLLTTQKSDTWYLQTALYMLLATLAWLIFRRLLYSPLWWMIWLPLRIVWRSGKAASSIAGKGGRAAEGGARMEVVREADWRSTIVGVGEEEAGPTVQITNEKREVSAEDSESLVDKVMDMMIQADSVLLEPVEEVFSGGTGIEEESSVWEGNVEASRQTKEVVLDGQRARDEL